jgi:8-oxo-dGTP pyrophosphatase MutT (NUDIX family)
VIEGRPAPAERELTFPTLRPKDAATLIVIDRRGRAPKVLMGLRHESHKFMPGKFVFPGGRIELGDRSMPAAGALGARAEAALMARVRRPSPTRARALALAAIRETYEETGLLLGTREYGAPENVPQGPWSAFAAHGVFPDLESLQVVARAITPPGRPKRFDTRFLAVDRKAIAHEVPGFVGPQSELTELAWVTLAEAARLDLPSITRSILQELEARIAEDFLPELPVPFFHMVHRRFVRELI